MSPEALLPLGGLTPAADAFGGSPCRVLVGWRTQHLKQRTAHAFKEVEVLRAELERAEAAVVGGKKKRDSDVEERETQLRRCQEEIRRLEAEVRFGLTTLRARGRQRMTKQPWRKAGGRKSCLRYRSCNVYLDEVRQEGLNKRLWSGGATSCETALTSG